MKQIIPLILLLLIPFSQAYEISYYHNDHLGSTSTITKQDGSLISHIKYDLFGQPFNNPSIPAYNQKEHDETKLTYFEARYQDPETGRFLTPDTIEKLTPYQYTKNNPLKYTDPTGKNPVAMGIGITAGEALAWGLTGLAVSVGITDSQYDFRLTKALWNEIRQSKIDWENPPETVLPAEPLPPIPPTTISEPLGNGQFINTATPPISTGVLNNPIVDFPFSASTQTLPTDLGLPNTMMKNHDTFESFQDAILQAKNSGPITGYAKFEKAFSTPEKFVAGLSLTIAGHEYYTHINFKNQAEFDKAKPGFIRDAVEVLFGTLEGIKITNGPNGRKNIN